jgi:hypothetical protein
MPGYDPSRLRPLPIALAHYLTRPQSVNPNRIAKASAILKRLSPEETAIYYAECERLLAGGRIEDWK